MTTPAEFNQLKLKVERLERDIVNLRMGHIHPVGGSLSTLDVAPATSTVFEDRACTRRSTIILTAHTADAATEAVAGSLRVVPNDGFFTVYHTSSANSRRFRYAVLTPYKHVT